MVDVKDHISLESFSGSTCIGISPGRNATEIVLSYRNGLIAVYDVTSRRCVTSWQLSVTDKLTSSTIYDNKSAFYYAVKNKTELMRWSHDINEISRFSIIKVPNEVHSIMTPPNDTPNDLIIVVYSNGHVEFCDFDGGTKRKKARKSNMNHTLTTEEKSATNQLHTEDYGEFVGMETVGSYLLTCWSNGLIIKTEISNEVLELSTSPCLVKQSSPISAMTPINDHLFAVLFSSHVVRVHDVHYGTCQYNLQLTDIKGSLPNKIACCHGYLIVPLPSGIRGYPIPCPNTITLSTAIGKGSSINHHNRTYQLDDSDITTSIVKFDATTIDGLIERCVANPSLWISEETLTNLTSIVDKLLNDKEVWPHSILLSIIESKVFPINYIHKLLEKCLELHDWVLIVAVLRNVDVIPEVMFIEVLKASLVFDKEMIPLDDSGKHSITKSDLICLVLSLIKSDSLLHQPFTELSHHHLMILLNFLTDKIEEYGLLASSTGPLCYEHILDWYGLILDTHFTSLILIPSVKPVLLKLREQISDHLSVLSHLNIVGQITSTKQQLTSRKQDNNKWSYKIDTVNFSI